MKRFSLCGLVLLLLSAVARADIIDYPDAGFFGGYTASGTYASCGATDSTTYATPTDGVPFVVRPCLSSSTATLQQAFTAHMNWPPTCSVTTGVWTVELTAVNPSNDTSTSTWAVAVACCSDGTSDCTNKTFGTEQTITLTDVATANATFIKSSNGTGAAPGSYTNLTAGTRCDFRIVRKHSTSLSDATTVNVVSLHTDCP